MNKSTPIGSFGELKRVDIRSVWNHEAHNFTPWLADNIDKLAQVLGLELELETREASVGGFSLDLLARDLNSDRPVVIENQFGSTDHGHLGKLMTYAAGFDASAVIWVVESIREEHRQALDWLNQRTDAVTHFFAVVVEVLQIDDSRPAYNFKLVVFPNDWQKSQRRRRERTVSSRSEAYRNYFQQLIDVLREDHRFTAARLGQPQNWYSFGAGLSGVSYGASFALGSRVRTEIYMGTGDEVLNQAIFKYFESDKEVIEEELGQQVEWESMDDRVSSRIAVYRHGSIDDIADLGTIHEWHVTQLLAFKRVFGPRLRRFKETHAPA